MRIHIEDSDGTLPIDVPGGARILGVPGVPKPAVRLRRAGG